MKYIPLLFSMMLMLASINSVGQRHPENEPIMTYNTGVYAQDGPGAENSAYNWTYPYGTKLTTHMNVDRNFEIMTIDKAAKGLVFRQWVPVTLTTGSWTSWKRIVTENESGNVGKLKEMNMLLLKKVEELTLYLIDQNTRMQSLEREIKKMKAGACQDQDQ